MIDLGGFGEGQKHQPCADNLGKEGSQGHPQHPQGDIDHQEDIQPDIHQTANHQEVEGPPGIPHRPQDAGTHVVDEISNDSQKVNPDVGDRMGQHILRGVHGPQGNGGDEPPENHQGEAPRQGEGHSGVHRTLAALPVPGPVKLGDNHRRAGSDTHKKAHQEVNEGAGGPAHGSQGLLSHILPHNHRVGGVIKLLKKGPQKDGEEKGEQRLPNHAAGDAVLLLDGLFQGYVLPQICASCIGNDAVDTE